MKAVAVPTWAMWVATPNDLRRPLAGPTTRRATLRSQRTAHGACRVTQMRSLLP